MGKTEKPLLARNIITRRKALGLNQAALAHAVGVHVNTIKDIERGLSEGRPDTRQAIATALGCSVSDLFDASGTSQAKPRSLDADVISAIERGAAQFANKDLSLDKQRLLAIIPNLSDARVRILLDLLNEHAVFSDEKKASASLIRKR